jgi:hypothetical protein
MLQACWLNNFCIHSNKILNAVTNDTLNNMYISSFDTVVEIWKEMNY